MATIKVTRELPEGVTVDTSEYEASHGTPADTDGRWLFGDGPSQFVWNGLLTDAVEELPEGDWTLLP